MKGYLQQQLKSKIAKAFASKGYPATALIQQHTFFQVLDELRGDTFNEQMANGLWDQIEQKSNEEASIDLVVKVIYEALMSTLSNVSDQQAKIKLLEARRQQLQADTAMEAKAKQEELKRVNDELEVLTKDLAEFRQDLEMLTVPFGIKLPTDDQKEGKKNPQNKQDAENKSEEELEWAIQTAMAIEQILM